MAWFTISKSYTVGKAAKLQYVATTPDHDDLYQLVSGAASVVFTNNGAITFTGSHLFATYGFFEGAPVTVRNTGTLTVYGDAAVYSEYDAPAVDNTGVITVVGSGLTTYGVGGAAGLSNSGVIEVTGPGQVIAAAANGINNSGTIRASLADDAASYAQLTAVMGGGELINSGSIVATPGPANARGTAVNWLMGHIVNTGDISGAIAIESGYGEGIDGSDVAPLTVENHGTITGEIVFRGDDDRLLNDHSIVGGISFGFGDDELDGTGGKITGDVSGGDGADQLFVGSLSGGLHGNAGDDTLRATAGAAEMDGDEGDDWIAPSSDTKLVDGGRGYDVVDYSAAAAALHLNVTASGLKGPGGAPVITLQSIEGVRGSAFADRLVAGVSLGDGEIDLHKGEGALNIRTIEMPQHWAQRADAPMSLDGAFSLAYNPDVGFLDVDAQGFRYERNTSTTIPHATVQAVSAPHDLNGGGTGDYYTFTAAHAGQVLSLDLDDIRVVANLELWSAYDFDTSTSPWTMRQEDLLAWDAGTPPEFVNAWSDLGQTPEFTFTLPSAGVYLVRVGLDTEALPSDTAYTLHLSLTDAPVQATSAVGGFVEGGGGNDDLVGGTAMDTASYAHAAGAVRVDLAHGRASGADGADTLTGIESVAGSAFDDTLIGGSGETGVTYALASGGVQASLALGEASGAGGHDHLSGFRDLTGSAFDDVLEGDGGDNLLVGGGGTDTVSFAHAASGVDADLYLGRASGDGADRLVGVSNLIGSDHDDRLAGNSGANTLVGGLGDDTLIGAYGSDTADYSGASAGVQADLLHGRATGGAGNDVLSGIENFVGSAFDDVVTPGAMACVLDMGSGDDTVLFGPRYAMPSGEWAGHVTVLGGAGIDTLDFSTEVDGVDFVQLDVMPYAFSTPSIAEATSLDQLFYWDVENVVGSHSADRFIAESVDNRFLGMNGDDFVQAGGGDDTVSGGLGNDTLNGGDGFDWLDMSDATKGATVSLAVTAPQATGRGTDTITDFEAIRGGAGADVFVGGAGANVLDGQGGDDRLAGGDGADTLHGGAGGDVLDGGAGVDLASYVDAVHGVSVDLSVSKPQDTGGAGVDTLLNVENVDGGIGSDALTGNGYANVLTGGAGGDTLNGGGGDDRLDGGDGVDTASFADARGAISLDVQAGTATGAGSDVLVSIENAVGGSAGDRLSGSSGANLLDGRSGDDRLDGRAGNDQLLGGDGADTLIGGRGADRLTGGAGADVFVFTATAESGRKGGDLITDVSAGDRIDVSAIDADAGQVGQQHFRLVDHFDRHAGEVTLVYDAGKDVTEIRFYTGADATPDMVVQASGHLTTVDLVV